MTTYSSSSSGEAPTPTGEVDFECDYQPNVTGLEINTAGTQVPVSYILFVPKKYGNISFQTENEISCNGQKGIIVLSIPYFFGYMLYVK